MVLSGNRKTAYYHALFAYNQSVTQKRGKCDNKNCKTFPYKNHKSRSKHLWRQKKSGEVEEGISPFHIALYLLSKTSQKWLFGNSEQPLFALPFACIDNCAEIMNFIMRVHPLHFTSLSTSFHDFIHFIELTHTAELAEWDDCDAWRSRMH